MIVSDTESMMKSIFSFTLDITINDVHHSFQLNQAVSGSLAGKIAEIKATNRYFDNGKDEDGYFLIFSDNLKQTIIFLAATSSLAIVVTTARR